MRDTFGSLAEARVALARQAVSEQPRSADLLFALADALAALGDLDEYARVFQQAYLLKPSSQPKFDAPLPMADAVKLRDKTEALIARGICYSPVLAASAFASAALGDRAATRALVDYDRFFRLVTGIVPQDFDGGDFYAELAQEIKAGLVFHDAPKRRAIRQAWRNNRIMESPLPACRAFADEMHRQVAHYVDTLPSDPSHPFIAARPAEYKISAWAVVSGSEGHHLAHIHPNAWLSGVFYVVRSAISRQPGSDRGWLRVGPPDGPGGTGGLWQERMIEPEPGHLVLMPGYFYHESVPMGVEQERICIAFDVMPLELSYGRGALE